MSVVTQEDDGGVAQVAERTTDNREAEGSNPSSPTMTADTSKKPSEVWPQVEAHRGGVYGFIDPAWGNHMIAMTFDTWQDVMQDVRTMKARLDQLSAENIEMKQGRKVGEEKKIILLNPPGRIVQ